jgi:hypothetical protein
LTTEPQPRRIGRRAVFLAALTLAGSTAFVTWWNTSLFGLPDVGDPFDVAAFGQPIPDETNAFVLYRKAASLLPEEHATNANDDWKTADTQQRVWFERSQEALAIWRKGTERPDAHNINPEDIRFDTNFDVIYALRSFARLALLKGSRLEESGNSEEALDWYIALLRSTRHSGRYGAFTERIFGIAMHRWASTRLIRWSADPKVDARLLRRALDAAIAADAATPPTSHGLKMEYLLFLHSMNNSETMAKMHDLNATAPSASGQRGPVLASENMRKSLINIRRRVINDPERSRRVARMIFANWLAYCDLPSSQRPSLVLPPSKNPEQDGPGKTLLGDLFIAGEDAPWQARALPPEELAKWYASTIDAQLIVPSGSAVERAIVRERSAQDALLYNLANELYKREHGQYPEHAEDLVGPYLKSLPEGYKPIQ